MSFLNGLQRVLVFTHDEGVLGRLRAIDQVSQNKLDVSVLLRSIGISLVDDIRRKEIAYIGVTQ